MCVNSTEGNKNMYKSMKNKAKQAFAEAVGKKAEDGLNEFKNCPNRMF